ncbi:MAG: oligoendopeptidase F, partial [Deltaproteobacteria bacterium]
MRKEPESMSASEQSLDSEQGWNLSDLYAAPDDPAVSSDLQKSLKAARNFQTRYQGKEIPLLNPPEFLLALKQYEGILEEGLKPFLYGSLLFSEDTQNPEYKSL